LEFSGKRVFIAPYTPKTTMFATELQEAYPFTFLGFLDNFQEGDQIMKPSQISEDYDYIIILSANYGNAIFKDFSTKLPQHKLIKVEQQHGIYHYLRPDEVQQSLTQEKTKKRKQIFLKHFARVLDALDYKRHKIVFISKSSITSNNKALFIHCFKKGLNVWMLTDNAEQHQELHSLNLPAVWLDSYQAYILLAQAKITVQDQANLTEEINLLTPRQKSLQMWHGIPLKRLGKLTTIFYNYLVSTSDFVNETTLGKVITAKEYKDFGYPRNDLLLKDEHDEYDLLFCDRTMYDFAQQSFDSDHTIILYMPTHRESSKASKIPLDFIRLNEFLRNINATIILKLHHFVQELYQNEETYSNILFHSPQGDVYPLLKYADILITDYSSVYFDFLLLNRPIVFFDYDYEEYNSNMGGFVYDYDENAPGEKVENQTALTEALARIIEHSDHYETKRLITAKRFFSHIDHNSAQRIYTELLT
jgi:CDP-glycerol glycerophosphotransferase (TagB/SpsB family)